MRFSGLIICFIFTLSVFGFAQDYAILVQESPVGAGQIKPGIGVHTFNANEEVTLTTVPEPGWHFVYWLGDVFNPTSNRTMVSVDGPKIIIAVFQRNEYELPQNSAAISVGPEILTPRVDASGSGGGGISVGPQKTNDTPTPIPYPIPIPMPEPIPEPVPEPHTAIFLFIGGCIIRNRKIFFVKQGSKIKASWTSRARSPESFM
ncbi:MAG: hypothetical protein JW806_04740 [Sedimentisphaerales bacterium]|nr:hypothetical protein [Sedimentisphaerales bacterium]